MIINILLIVILIISNTCVGKGIERAHSDAAIGKQKLSAFVAEYKRPYTTCTVQLIEHPQQSQSIYLGKKSFWATIGKVSHFLRFGYAYQMEVQDETGIISIANFKKEIIFRPGKEIILDYENKTAHIKDRPLQAPIGVSGEFAADVIRYANGVEPIIARIAQIDTFTTRTKNNMLYLKAPIPSARDKRATTMLTFVFDLNSTNSLLREYRVGTDTGNDKEYFEGIWHFTDWNKNSGRLRPQKLAFETKFYPEKPMNSNATPQKYARRDFTIIDMAYDDHVVKDETWNVPSGFQVIRQ